MRYVAAMCMVVMALVVSPVWASGECKIEAWRAFNPVPNMLMVEGSTTCKKGSIKIRLYSGSGDSAKFIGIASGFIEGYSFELMASNVNKPSVISIKYSIDPQGGL